MEMVTNKLDTNKYLLEYYIIPKMTIIITIG